MSWIKENKFIATLGGATLVLAGLLYFVGSKAATRYDEARQSFEETNSEASGFESGALYPKVENRIGKNKALDDYRKSLDSLQESVEKFRPKEFTNVSPQSFTVSLKAADEELRKAFEQSKTKVPDAFFVGFESYRTSLAQEKNTGILNFQLQAIKETLLNLAKAAPTELRNFHRPNLPEEVNQPFAQGPNDVVRALPFELTFIGSEKSAREFLSSVVKLDNYFITIKGIRITNAKKDPPKAADAKFDAPPSAAAVKTDDDAFGGAFVLPGDTPAGDQPAADAPPEPKAPPATSGRILSQVLGSEEVQVFVRLDLLQFLPAKKLP